MESKITLQEILDQRTKDTREQNNNYSPLFFRIGEQKQKQELQSLLQGKPYIKVSDTIHAQLSELVKTDVPNRTITSEEVEKGIEKRLGSMSFEEYGVWVYYPWSERLVHILDEDEFIRLRTNRNKYKITDEERIKLSSKKIGVIGLSVGQSVSLTLAMERTFGELRIADFDELEITNLNRLRSGIHNMGLKKTVLVAREIAEIDPFLKVTCFHDGITPQNLESFLLENGKLDVLIDECDGVDIKINCRIAAKKHQIPVLMEASDRATIDIERFDLEPERPILHGFIEHLDITNVKEAKTMEEKLPFILPIVGIETMSARLKASAVEIGQTISTWPQLASAVTLGGGITADICRRVLLDQLHQSGRYFIDIDELIGDPKEGNPVFNYNTEPLTAEQMSALAAQVPAADTGNQPISQEIIDQLVEAAAIAPSPGNNQPWKWYSDRNRLFLFHDIHRSASYGDFENMASYVSLGTALENLKLKASALNTEVEINLFPLPATRILTAVCALSTGNNVIADPLADYLNIRFTNRNLGKGGSINPAWINEMKSAASAITGASLKVIESDDEILKMADIAGKSEKLRLFIPQGHFDLFEKELRWTAEDAEKTRDGLDIRTLELSAKDEVGFRVVKDPRAMKLVSEWGGGRALENMTRNLVATSSAVAIVTMPAFTPENCVLGGEAAQRAWLTATKYSLSVQPVLAPILHFARLIHGNGIDMPLNIQKQFKELNEEFLDLFKLNPSKEEALFLFRICFADTPKVKSLRLDLNDVFFRGNINR